MEECMRLRKDREETRRIEAKERKQKYDKLTPSQKIELLDKKLGKGIGAKKQRAKLQG